MVSSCFSVPMKEKYWASYFKKVQQPEQHRIFILELKKKTWIFEKKIEGSLTVIAK